MRLLRLIIILFSSALAGCAAGAPPFPEPGEIVSDPVTTDVTGYIPFVEEVGLPEVIYEEEYFTVTLRLSAVLKPDLFNGANQQSFMCSGGGILQGYPSGWEYDTWMWPARNPGGPVNDSIEVRFPGLPAGDWAIGIWQLKKRELGGMKGLYRWTPGMYPLDYSHQELVIYPITVIERPAP